MKKRLLSAALTLIVLLSGLAVNLSSLSAGGAERKKYNFIFVCPITENEYWQSCIDGIRQADRDLGTNTLVIGSDTSEDFVEKTVEYMRQAVDKNPDGILAYAGINDMYPIINEAADKNIPVIALDSDAPGTKRTAFVGPSDYSLGYAAGQSMTELIDEGTEIGIVVTSKEAEREMRIVEAFRNTVSDYNIKSSMVAESEADGETAKKLVRGMISGDTRIGAVFATGAMNAEAAGEIKKELGRDDIVVIGFDDTEENMQLLREGYINSLIVQHPYQMGYQGVQLMKKCVDNGRLDKEYYNIGSVTVNMENIDSYTDSSMSELSVGKKVRVGYYSGDPELQSGFSDNERKSGYAYVYYQAISAYTGWSYEYVYGSRGEIMNKLAKGEIDIAAGVYKTRLRQEQMLFSEQSMGLDGQPRYFALSKERSDLKKELDFAMEQLAQSSPSFKTELWQDYNRSVTYNALTVSEKEWLAEKKELTLGYVRYDLPYCDRDDKGNAVGVVSEVRDHLEDYLGVKITPVCYNSVAEMEDALVSGGLDMAFPIYSDPWLSEKKGIRQTNSFINDRLMVVYRDSYTEDVMNRIGVCSARLSQKTYAGSELVYYDTPQDMFRALMDGRERCLVGCASIMQRYISAEPEYKELNIAFLEDSQNFGMAVAHNNIILSGILNKAISQLDSAAVTNAMIRYASYEPSYTLGEFIQRHWLLFLLTAASILAILAVTFWAYIRKAHIFKRKQQEAQEELERALEIANTASEAKTNFLSSMSHDIRTPMNAISGMAAIAVKNIDDRDKVENCLRKITLSSHHLLTLINDVLDISKIESNNLPLTPVTFSLRDMMMALVDIIGPQLRAKDLDFSFRLHKITNEMVQADEVRLNQIFMNILSNAVKYTPDGGSVIIDLYEDLLDKNTVRVTYIVRDTGMGMTPEFMENMYNNFSRAQDNRISRIQGTGLGLAIVKRLVDTMEGTIDCESEVNKGTTFTIKIDMPVGEEEPVTEPIKDMKLLLIDGDDLFLMTSLQILENIVGTVDTASSESEAIGLVKRSIEEKEPYSVIIIDWRMPGIKESIQNIRSVAGDAPPYIVVSSYDVTEVDIEDDSIYAFVSKPFFGSYIYEELRDILGLDNSGTVVEKNNDIQLSGRHLLVAEDNDLNWEVVSELLDMRGVTAERAENGRICVDMLMNAAPDTYDAILMDIQMPEMNGREAAKIIRGCDVEWIKSIPIIAMTADAFAEDIAACEAVGMNGHVSKPVDMDKLCQELQKYPAKKHTCQYRLLTGHNNE